MAEWTATSIIKTKTEYDVLVKNAPTGNKAINYGFTSDILRDAVKHHEYNEPNVGIPRGKTLDKHIADIIESHLVFWKFSETQPDSESLPDVSIVVKPPPDPDPKAEEKAAMVEFGVLLQVYAAEKAAFDAGLEKTDTAVVAAQEAVDDFYVASAFKDALKLVLSAQKG